MDDLLQNIIRLSDKFIVQEEIGSGAASNVRKVSLRTDPDKVYAVKIQKLIN